MDWSNAQGAPLIAAVIVMVAIIALGGLSIAFSGHVQF